MIGPITSSWVYGSVRSDDAYKAGGGVSDVIDIHFLEQYNLVQPQTGDDWMGPLTWTNHYKAISRTNFALQAINEAEEFRPEDHSYGRATLFAWSFVLYAQATVQVRSLHRRRNTR